MNLHFVLDRRSFCNVEYNLKVFDMQGFILTKKKQNSSSWQNVIYFCCFDRRGCIQRVALQQWPGNDFPNFRLAKEKTKLDELAASPEKECLIPEISFGTEEIKKHKQSVFNERRRVVQYTWIDTSDQMDNCWYDPLSNREMHLISCLRLPFCRAKWLMSWKPGMRGRANKVILL